MLIITFILIAYGFCNIIIYGSLFEWWRKLLKNFGTGPYSLHKLFSCFMCLGTWAGFALSTIMVYFNHPDLTPMGYLGVTNVYLLVILNGFLTSAGVWLTHTLQEALERAFVRYTDAD